MTETIDMTVNTHLYNGSLTREQFLFHEMRIVASLVDEGCSDDEIVDKVVNENLFQFPTERMIKNLTKVCIRRVRGLEDEQLVYSLANDPVDGAKQVCLYAMMKDSRLVWDFMITVIGEKYRTQDLHFSSVDISSFFFRLQEQDEGVASWSESTVKKIKSVLKRVLIENDYLDNAKADHINPVWLNPKLENAIRSNNDDWVLPAFNCFT